MLKPEILVDIQKRIIERLNGKNLICPMCQNNKFELLNGYLFETLQDSYTSVILGGSGVPTVGIYCLNCGFISQHAIGVLGLLKKEVDDKSE
jgi:hypothetical protein